MKKGKRYARFKSKRGRTIEAPLSEDGQRVRLQSRIWRGEYKDANGKACCKSLGTDRTAAEQLFADLLRKAARGDPFEPHRARALALHLADWQQDLANGGAGPKQVRQSVACAKRVLDGCGFAFMGDLSASRVQTFLAELREPRGPAVVLDPAKTTYTRGELAKLLGVQPNAITPVLRRHRLPGEGEGKARRYPRETAEALLALRAKGRSIKTSNLHLAAVKQFCHWLVQDRRMPENPLEHLAGGNVKLDRRHDRRALSPEELALVLQTARESDQVFRNLTGRDRHFLYLAAMTTGYRAGELACLTPESFALDADPPEVTLAAAFTKNKRPAQQPVPPAVAQSLAGYLAGKPAGQLVWPGTWFEHAADMLRVDLEPAGIAYVLDTQGGPLYADFHALRHSYIALLDRAGATLKEAMQLARHSDPKLTMAVYGRARLTDLGTAIEGMPLLLYSPNKAGAMTGTDGAPVTRLDQTDGDSCGRRMTANESAARVGSASNARNILPVMDVEKGNGMAMTDDESSAIKPYSSRNSRTLARGYSGSYCQGFRGLC